MLTLALDTTTRAGSVAITDEDRVLAVHAGDPTRTHGERLPGEIDAALTAAGIDRSLIDLLVVASGPGAFTGLRIGLAAMQGLAMTLGKPIIGVSALDALAWTALNVRMIPAPIREVPSNRRGEAPSDLRDAPSDLRVATWMDAQRGEVFSAVYREGPGHEWPLATEAQPAVGTPDAILGNGAFDPEAPTVFIGDGARRYAETIAAASAHWIVSAQDPPLAPALAWIGRRLAAAGHATTPHALQPLYVRRPDAEIERDRLVRQPGRHSPSSEGGSDTGKGGPGHRSPTGGGGPVHRSPTGGGGPVRRSPTGGGGQTPS